MLQLSEFFPGNPGLLGLNVNRGAEVKIRLRPARDAGSFYDWNHVLGTMLHEVGTAATAGQLAYDEHPRALCKPA